MSVYFKLIHDVNVQLHSITIIQGHTQNFSMGGDVTTFKRVSKLLLFKKLIFNASISLTKQLSVFFTGQLIKIKSPSKIYYK